MRAGTIPARIFVSAFTDRTDLGYENLEFDSIDGIYMQIRREKTSHIHKELLEMNFGTRPAKQVSGRHPGSDPQCLTGRNRRDVIL